VELTSSPGLVSREVAISTLAEVLDRKQPLEESFERALARSGSSLEPRDRGFARLTVTTTLRRLGEIDALLAARLERPLPADAGRVRQILRITAAQLVFLGTPAHAAVDSAVSLTRREDRHLRLAGLVNAVSRRLAEAADTYGDKPEAGRLDTPDWLWRRWAAYYGEATALRLAAAHLGEPALDLTVKANAEDWAVRLGGEVLATGSVRLAAHGRIEELPGFEEGGWWVQDAAAALPARLLGDVAGLEVADLCAAPGGKTAQLAAAGARVTAVDSSLRRLGIARRNLERLKLEADLVETDIRSWEPDRTYTRIILDAPCLATGTIRRHPDLPHLKAELELVALAERQRALLGRALALLAHGGTLVYSTCSLEPEEGEQQIAAALAADPGLAVDPVRLGEAGVMPQWITAEGYLRTLPFHSPGGGPNVAGMDGFFAARLVRTSTG
jgi:16S rRNA (cytosine967-C5)-methyltransferase